MRVHVGGEILHAGRAQARQHRGEAGFVAHQRRHGRALEQARGEAREGVLAAAQLLARRDVLDRDQEAGPVVLVARQHPARVAHVEDAAADGAVAGDEPGLRRPRPELAEHLDQGGGVRVVEDRRDVGEQLRRVAGLVEPERVAVHPLDPDQHLHGQQVLGMAQPGAQVAHAGRAPRVQAGLEGAQVLQPERYRREFEQLGLEIAGGRRGMRHRRKVDREFRRCPCGHCAVSSASLAKRCRTTPDSREVGSARTCPALLASYAPGARGMLA